MAASAGNFSPHGGVTDPHGLLSLIQIDPLLVDTIRNLLGKTFPAATVAAVLGTLILSEWGRSGSHHPLHHPQVR